MPTKQEKRRGGVIRYRTKDIGKGKYIHIAVVRKKGKRGGKTLAGPIHIKKKSKKK